MTDYHGIVPPHDPTAELIVAGSAFVREADLDMIPDVHAGMFYDASLGSIFGACVELHESNLRVSPEGVVQRLRQRGQLDAIHHRELVGRKAVLAVREDVPTSAAIKSMSKTVIRLHALRVMGECFARAALEAKQGKVEDIPAWMSGILATADEVVGHEVPEARGTVQRAQDLQVVLQEERKPDGKGKGKGPLTGLRFIDEFLPRGLEPGKMIVICGRPGAGKSTLVDQIGETVARAGLAVLEFSLEMSIEEVTRRQVCRHSRVPSHEMASCDPGIENTNNQAIDRVLEGFKDRKRFRADLFVDDRRRSLQAIQSYTRLMQRRAKIGLVIIDHMGLVDHGPSGWTSERRTSEIAISIKNLAGHLRLPIIVISQLNRNSEYRGNAGGDRRPQLIDLRASGEIEQSADVVLGLYHPGQRAEGGFRFCEGLMLKNRGGRIGSRCYAFDAPLFSIEDVADQAAARGAIKQREADEKAGRKPTTALQAAAKTKGGK